MDNVDYRYKDSIREALDNGSVSKLTQLIPSLSEDEAVHYIEKWKLNALETMTKIRSGQDTSELSNSAHNMLYDLLEKANLSAQYGRAR